MGGLSVLSHLCTRGDTAGGLIKLEVIGGRECGVGELEEGDQKAQTSSCRYNEQRDVYS